MCTTTDAGHGARTEDETMTAEKLAKSLFADDMGRADDVPVERDGERAYGWVRAAGEAGDRETATALAGVDRSEFAAAWDALVEVQS